MNQMIPTYLKLDMCRSDTFSLYTHFSSDMKHAISVRNVENLNRAPNHLPCNFWSSCEYLVPHQSEGSCAC